jgi:hypothetical protein
MALGHFRNVYLPYCLQRVSGGDYIVLNREYKPIGQCTEDVVEYATHRMKFLGLGPKLATKISCRASPDLDVIYLYDDGCQPEADVKALKQYFARLALLLKLKVTPPEVMPMY